MLDCKLCNYYEPIKKQNGSSVKGFAKCEFTDVTFIENVDNLDIPYPCRNLSLADYANRSHQNTTGKIQELTSA